MLFKKKTMPTELPSDRIPVLFEVVPPIVGKEKERLEQHTEYLGKLFREVHIDALNLPEIQDESSKSKKGKRRSPYKERVEPREYARALSERFDTDFVINRVIVKLPPDEQERWLLETRREYGINKFVFVGGESPEIKYPGPSVPDGNKMAKQYLNRGKLRYNEGTIEPADFEIGNICIPTRHEEGITEAERMFFKYQTGTDFFTTQIIAESDSARSLLKDFSQMIADDGGEAPTIFWSFTPVSSSKDIDFLRFLGVYIPEETEKQLLDSDDPGATSLEIFQTVWGSILEFNRRLPVPFSMGVNITSMGLRNFDNAIMLAKNMGIEGITHPSD